MRVTRGLGGAALAVVFALSLTGCVPQTHTAVPPAPSPSSTPVFASDEEALAAATKAYAAYLKVSDEIAQDGGKNPERLSALVSSDWLENEVSAFTELKATGHHQVGSSKFDHVKLQDLQQGTPETARVRIYLCLDFSDAQLVDSQGHDVRPQGLDARSPFQASFESSQAKPRQLLLTESELWPGVDFC